MESVANQISCRACDRLQLGLVLSDRNQNRFASLALYFELNDHELLRLMYMLFCSAIWECDVRAACIS